MRELIDRQTLISEVASFMGRDAEGITLETHLYDDLDMDSLGLFSLGMQLIRTFQVRIPLSEVAGIATVGDMHAALLKHAVNTAS